MGYDNSLATLDVYMGALRLLDKAGITAIELPRRHSLTKTVQILPQGGSRTILGINTEANLCTITLSVFDKTLYADLRALFSAGSFAFKVLDSVSGEILVDLSGNLSSEEPKTFSNEGSSLVLKVACNDNSPAELKALAV